MSGMSFDLEENTHQQLDNLLIRILSLVEEYLEIRGLESASLKKAKPFSLTFYLFIIDP